MGNDFRLQQVLTNLIGNAIKFTSSGKIMVTAALQAEAAPQTADEIVLIFKVQDIGIGIDVAKQDDLFQPFVQAGTSTTRQFGGTGLGLTICRRIVQTMGGDIGVHSELETGSTFWFTVPLTVATMADRMAATAQLSDTSPLPVSQSEVARSSAKLLVVEDYKNNREILLTLLDALGYEADAAVNRQDFLDRGAEQDYDIVLMDDQMPVIDGYEATRQLRQREGKSKHTIVIGVTAHALETDRQKCLEAGMDDYLTQPIEFEELARILQRWATF
jgi:two-component system CheB/CheR fusion protein